MTTPNTLITKRRRLFFDLEVSGNLGIFWTAGFKLNIGPENIIKERAIICACWKWEEEQETHSLTWDAKQCDKKLLIQFIKILNEATEIVGHNGDRFDLAWIRTRCLYHHLDMFPTYLTIDTLKIARSKFKFNSNKLDYIAKFLGLGEKIKTDFGMWKEIMLNKDKVAMDKMVKYCKMDVILLEKVYKELGKHIVPKTHYGVIFGEGRGTCPECGSEDIIKRGYQVSVSGSIKTRFSCNTCFKYHSKIVK